VTQPTALVAIGGDDVYEDLFTASRKLADITVDEGLVTRAVLGTERLTQAAAAAGLVLLYTAMGSFSEAYALIGSRYASHGPPPHESRFTVQTDQGHPLTRGLSDFEITHEHYHLELTADARVVAWRDTEPVVHVREEGRGRVAYIQLGHDMRVWDDPKARALMTRCIGWVLR
jgi:uncharacterized protein